ncbi:unnamed protein product [Brassica napus]|uniref:(rape) hypothetical protein n=1 Tax=Brassica napus TaxID=3708 RepID=A0A816JUB4_BRANA|nr:unnamed protein product [Brassica napus]
MLLKIRMFIRIMRLRVDAHVLDMETLTATLTVLLTWRIDIGYFRDFAGRYGLLSPFNQIMSLYRKFGGRYYTISRPYPVLSLLSEYFYLYVSLEMQEKRKKSRADQFIG